MKLCITGGFGNKDIGDEAMLTEYLRYLDDIGFHRDDIYLIGHRPQYISWYHNHPLDKCIASKRIPPHIVQNCTKLLFTGGGTINSYRSKSINRTFGLIQLFRGKKIFMSGQTIGPILDDEELNKKVKFVIENVDYLSLRDLIHSKKAIDKLGAKPRIFKETCDDAVNLQYKDAQLSETILDFIDKDTIAFNITDFIVDTPEKVKQVINIINRLLEDFKLLLVCNHPSDYEHFEDLILPHISLKNILMPNTVKMKGNQLKKMISLCKIAVGSRYHFLVFAGTTGTPFIGLAGDEYSYIKQSGFAQQIGLQDMIIAKGDLGNLDYIQLKMTKARHLSFRNTFISQSIVDFTEWIKS